ncbi:MAG: thioredoxin family protein [Cyanobacteria bacterium REEB67]|nr:thioredoxin family protein [Cyanobacteria bacterium REEB67]
MSRMEPITTLDRTPQAMPQVPEFGDNFRLPPLGTATEEITKPVDFAPNLRDAITRGQQTGRPVVVVFEEDNCGWCKRFDSELSKPAVSALGGDAIFVKASPSKDPAAQALARNLGVDAYPTVSVLNVSDHGIMERTRMVGYMTADDFASRFRTHGQTQMA